MPTITEEDLEILHKKLDRIEIESQGIQYLLSEIEKK